MVLGKVSTSTSALLIKQVGRHITDKEEAVSAFKDHFIYVDPSLADEIEVKSKTIPLNISL